MAGQTSRANFTSRVHILSSHSLLFCASSCPAMAPACSSSSSSEEEDLSLFASCAVSADQIEKSAEADAKRRVLKASQRPIASAARSAAAATTPAQHQGSDDEAPPPGSTGLDLISEKVRRTELTQPPQCTWPALHPGLSRLRLPQPNMHVHLATLCTISLLLSWLPQPNMHAAATCLALPQIATALDAILARELDERTAAAAAAVSTPPKRSQQKTAAARDEDQPGVVPAVADTAADAVSSDDGTGVQLFRAVPKGTPCVIQQDSRAAWDPLFPDQAQQQQQGADFGSGSMRQQQRLRDQIPRLCLAERSRQASKRKHEAVLAALAVEGAALQAAAAAAGYPCSNSSKASTKGGRAGSKASTTAAWVKGWKRMKGQKAEGTVVDAKQWVPYEIRAAKLLGMQHAC